MMKNLLLLLVLSLGLEQAYSQQLAVYGSVHSEMEGTSLPGAIVQLENPADTLATVPTGMATNLNGKFRFENIVPGEYIVNIRFVGFVPYSRTIRVDHESVNLGTISLEEDIITMESVQIIGRVPLGDQLGDTTQFNAGAFKTSPNANAENLIQKMPGITVQDGKIQAQGEDVTEILVNGQRFFEGDVEAALKNLPAEIIANIQIFDKKSDRAEFSGFDDGNRAKTINIVTKPDTRVGQFGQASVGYGTDKRYMVGASVNLFNYDRRITITGISNNINSSGYSIGETPGSGLRGDSQGNTNTNRISLNYNDTWGDKIEISGNYTYDHRRDVNELFKFREYILPSDSGQVYNEDNLSTNTDAGQRLRMRMEYNINDNNRLIVEPRISIEQNNSDSYFLGRTRNDYEHINQTESNSISDQSGIDFENEIHYFHRFGKKGRTFSTSLKTGFNSSTGETYRTAENIFYNSEDPYETIDQYKKFSNDGLSWEANLSYTEPVGEKSRVQLEYEIGNTIDDSDRRTFNFEEQTENYTELDTLLSNTFKSDYLTQEFEAGYQYSMKKIRVEVEAEYQRASLKNDQVFPRTDNIDRVFHSILPSLELEYRFTKLKNLRLDYRARTNAPSVGNLQNVIDNTNPLQLSTGNPNLKQSYQNRLSLHYKSFNAETNKVFYARLRGTLSKNTIANSTFIADTPTELADGIVLESGSQLIRPVNLEESNWDIEARVNYGQPLDFLKSNVGLEGTANYTSSPGMINNEINFSNSSNFRIKASLSSNISEKIDFNISTRSSYTVVDNSLRPQLDNNYFNQSTRLSGDLIFWKGIVFRTELDHQLNSGLSEGYDNNFLLWNMSISKTLFNDASGEISLSINDLLKQNSNINRNITQLYIEDEQRNVLEQFFMLSFTYSFRHFNKSKLDIDFEG